MRKFAFRAFVLLTVSLLATEVTSGFASFYFDENNSLNFYGDSGQEQFGTDIHVADLNRDGHIDLIVSSPFYSSEGKEQRGKVDVFFGPMDEKFASKKPDLRILGANANDLLGTSLSSGDLNGDGVDDLLVGAYQALVSENYRPGAVYMFMGRTNFFLDTYDLSVYQPDLSVYGPHHNSFFGASITMADMNGDNDLDIVAGAPLSQNNDGVVTGNVYVVNWQNSFSTNPFYDLSGQSPNILISGQKEGGLFGSIIKMGQINRNDAPDLLVSAYSETVDGKKEAGAVYLFLDFTSNSTYRKLPNVTFKGSAEYEWFGFQLNVANLNSDRFDDIFVSSFSFKKTLRKGLLRVVYGSDLFDVKEEFTFDEVNKPYYLTVRGFLNNHILGSGSIVQDLNRDGKAELLLSNPDISVRAVNPANVLIYEAESLKNLNDFSVLDSEPKWEIKSLQSKDWFGNKLISTDLNRDGRKDLVIAAPYADKGDMKNAGSVSVYFIKEGSQSTNDKEEQEEPENPKENDLSKDENRSMTRAEAVSGVMDRFELKNRYSQFIDSCYKNPDFCMFVFSSQSKFAGIRFEPEVILYPDVSAGNPHYEDITLATILGLVHGNINDKESPFKPDLHVSRIQALKMILEAAQLERSNFFAELVSDMGGEKELNKFMDIYEDVSAQSFHMWWYPRYVNFAYRIGVLSKEKNFRPDDAITKKEFDELLDKVYNFAR